eukprot:1383853-Rhodomonas_salina.3
MHRSQAPGPLSPGQPSRTLSRKAPLQKKRQKRRLQVRCVTRRAAGRATAQRCGCTMRRCSHALRHVTQDT